LDYLEALIKGNSKEIEVLYKKVFPLVKKFVLQNKGTTTDAKDIFQKALLQIAVRYKKEKFTITSNFEAYLFTVCRNMWRKELIRKKNGVTYDDALAHESTNMALDLLEQKRGELFNDVLGRISENCKRVLKLYFNKNTYADIVKEMKYASEVVARQRVFKCKAMLKTLILKDNRYQDLKEL
jgi:RNA polymerase sigma factor (sigma-70 family)